MADEATTPDEIERHNRRVMAERLPKKSGKLSLRDAAALRLGGEGNVKGGARAKGRFKGRSKGRRR